MPLNWFAAGSRFWNGAQRDRRFSGQGPAFVRDRFHGAGATITLIVTRPNHLPFEAERRREERLGGWDEWLGGSQVHHQQSFVVLFAEKAEHKTSLAQDSAVYAAKNLPLEPRILMPEADQIAMQIVKWTPGLTLRQVQFATLERFASRRHRQGALHLGGRDRRKLRQELEAAGANRFAQIVVADVRKKNERRRRAKFFALKSSGVQGPRSSSPVIAR